MLTEVGNYFLETIKFVIFVFFISSSVLAQTDYDTAVNNLQNKPDSIKIKLLNNYCLKLRGKNPQLALKYAFTAREIAEKNNYKNLLAESVNLIGVVYRNLGDLANAMTYHQNAIKIATEAKDTIQIAYSYNNISVIYRETSNYALALENAITALKIFEKINFEDGIGFTAINIGNIYKNQNLFNEALKNYKSALEIRIKQKYPDEIAHVLTYIAFVYSKLGNYNEALNTYFEAEKSYKQIDNKRGLGEVWNGIAQILENKNDLAVALEYRHKALDMFKELGYSDEYALTCGNISVLLAKNKNYGIGRSYVYEAVKLIHRTKSSETTAELYKLIAQYYEKANVKDSALYYFKLHLQLKDSVQYNTNLFKFAEMEALYRNEKIMRENMLLSKDVDSNKRQTLYLILIIALAVFIVIGTYTRFHSMKVTNKKLNDLNAMKDTFFRIIAHDLKSPFNAVFGYLSILNSSYKELSDEDKLDFLHNIEGAVSKSYQLLEQLLLWSRSNTGKLKFNPVPINLSQIINENIQLLFPTAEQKQIILKYICDDDSNIYADEEMIKTVIRNLISNSIKFTKTDGIITIHQKKETKFIAVYITDTGVGMTEEQCNNLFRIDKTSSTTGTKGEQGTGLGLLICKEFIDKHKGSINVLSTKGEGTTFIIKLPIDKQL